MDTKFVTLGKDAYYGAFVNSQFWPTSTNNYALDNLFISSPVRKFPFRSMVPESGLHVVNTFSAGYYREPVVLCVAQLETEVERYISDLSSQVVLAYATSVITHPFFDNQFDEIVSMYGENYLQKWRYDIQFAFQVLNFVGLEDQLNLPFPLSLSSFSSTLNN